MEKNDIEKYSAQVSQTGSPESPLQVEDVHYRATKSKIGLAASLSAIMAWIITFSAFMIVITAKNKFLLGMPDPNQESTTVLLFFVALLVPVVPIFAFLHQRIKKILVQNPASVDDVFFKRSIRVNLTVSLLLSVILTFCFVFSMLAKLFLIKYESLSWNTVVDNAIGALVLSANSLFFWGYQKITKR